MSKADSIFFIFSVSPHSIIREGIYDDPVYKGFDTNKQMALTRLDSMAAATCNRDFVLFEATPVAVVDEQGFTKL